MASKGKLIILEGADGAGTTSMTEIITASISEVLSGRVIQTREPSDGEIGRFIRKILKKDIQTVGRREMVHLFMADRIDHVRSKIRPNLEAGNYVVCDRYYISMLVYQSVVGKLEESKGVMWDLYNEMLACDGSLLEDPDMVIFLDARNDVLKLRRQSRGIKKELFEEDVFQRQVVELYRSWYNERQYTESRCRVDAEAGIETVRAVCWDLVKKII